MTDRAEKAVDLEAIKKRCEAANPRTWHFEPATKNHLAFVYTVIEEIGITMFIDANIATDADMEFIAHSRQDVPALLALVEALQRQLR